MVEEGEKAGGLSSNAQSSVPVKGYILISGPMQMLLKGSIFGIVINHKGAGHVDGPSNDVGYVSMRDRGQCLQSKQNLNEVPLALTILKPLYGYM